MSKDYRFRKLSQKENEIIDVWQKILPNEPIDVRQLAKEFGCKTKEQTMPAGLSGAILKDGNDYVIYVNAVESEDRKRFTYAHEIAHYLLHQDELGNGINDNIMFRSHLSNKYEVQANKIAADILMPSSVLDKLIAKREHGINELANIFGVSRSAFLVRLGIPEYRE